MTDFDDIALRRLDGTLLLVFEAAMDGGKLSAAAKRLGLTQSAVSHALKRLRSIFADELFVRTPHGVQPTPRALALREPLRAALDLMAGAIRPPRFDSARGGCDAMTLYDEDYLVVGRPGHPALEPPPDIDRHAAAGHVLTAPGGAASGIVDTVLAAHGRGRRVAITVPYFLAALATVARTDLIATVPRRQAARGMSAPRRRLTRGCHAGTQVRSPAALNTGASRNGVRFSLSDRRRDCPRSHAGGRVPVPSDPAPAPGCGSNPMWMIAAGRPKSGGKQEIVVEGVGFEPT